MFYGYPVNYCFIFFFFIPKPNYVLIIKKKVEMCIRKKNIHCILHCSWLSSDVSEELKTGPFQVFCMTPTIFQNDIITPKISFHFKNTNVTNVDVIKCVHLYMHVSWKNNEGKKRMATKCFIWDYREILLYAKQK